LDQRHHHAGDRDDHAAVGGADRGDGHCRFLGGVIAPSRDMLVRNAAPPGAAGRAFGIVSTPASTSAAF
jgi:hypothetical protein